MRQLPPLNQLKAFEAAGRLGSFKAASNELCVSEAAVSQHIRSLESYLGAPLFARTYSGVLLTDAGSEFVESLTIAFDRMSDASEKFRGSELEGSLRVSVAPSLGSRWLLPRLDRFSRDYPDISVDPIMTPSLIRLGSEADLAIRHGNGAWNEGDVTFLRDEALIPVASRNLLGRKQFKSPEQLLNYPLLTAANRKQEWPHWLISQGVTISSELKLVTYDTVALAIDAAVAGVGICLIDKALVMEDIKQRRLKFVIDETVPGIYSYYVIMPKSRTQDPKAIVLKEWLVNEGRQESF